MFRKTIIISGLYSLLLLLIQSCTTNATVTDISQIPNSNGLVIFKMSADSDNVGLFKYWQKLAVKSTDKTQTTTHFIGFSEKGYSRSGVYFGSLPAGEYRFENFSSQICGYGCTSSTLDVSDNLGTFIVKSNTITDLGHVIYKGVSKNRSLVAYGKSKDNWVSTYINKFYSEIPKSFHSNAMLGWKNHNEKMAELYTTLKAQSSGLLKPVEASNGVVLFGSYLGSVRVWTPGKGVKSFDTGAQGSIESIAELKRGNWLAGSENGQILESNDNGKSWGKIDNTFLGSGVLGLNVFKEKVFATVVNEKEASIYYRSLDQNNWKFLSKHPYKFSFWTGVLRQPDTIAYKNYLVTILPSKSLFVTDMETLISTEKEFPGSVYSFVLSNDGVIRTFLTTGLFPKPYESHDLGNTWIESTHIKYMYYPHFKDMNNGYGLSIVPTRSGPTSQLNVTADGGKTWAAKGTLPYGSQYLSRGTKRLWHLNKNGNLYTTDEKNLILMSNDNGISWNPQSLQR